MQQQHFEQVAHGLGVADDVVANRFGAKALAHDFGGFENRDFTARFVGIGGAEHAQRSRLAQQLQEQAALGHLVEPGIVGFESRHGQQFGHHRFVLIRALAQIDRGQMEAEDLDSADQRVQALRGQRGAVLALQRGFDRVQVGQEGLCIGVGILRRHGMACGFAAGQLEQGGGEAGINADQGAPVGLVLAVFIAVGRFVGQRLHGRQAAHQHARDREFAAQVVHLGQVMAQRHVGLSPQGLDKGLRVHIGVAVAVAADPLAHAQKAVHVLLAQFALQPGIDLGDFLQEGAFVIAQRVFNLVGNRELAVAQQPGLPELDDAGAHLLLVAGELACAQRVLADRGAAGTQADVVALAQQLGNRALGVQDALALHFGRVRCQHWRDEAAGQCVNDGPGRDAGVAQPLERHFDAAFLALAGTLVKGTAADVVPVLRQVDQVAEIGEGADHADGLVAAQTLEQLLERLVSGGVGIAPKSDRQRADLLDQRKCRHALLLPDDVAQDSPQQPDVLDQRLFIVRRATGRLGFQQLGHGFGEGSGGRRVAAPC